MQTLVVTASFDGTVSHVQVGGQTFDDVNQIIITGTSGDDNISLNMSTTAVKASINTGNGKDQIFVNGSFDTVAATDTRHRCRHHRCRQWH